MTFLYERCIRPALFLFSPDRVHLMALRIGKLFSFPPFAWLFRLIYHYEHPALKQELLGLTFSNPIGLSAGFDKDGEIPSAIRAVGFGFEEVGSVTAEPYAGNTPPWATRLVQDEGLIVNYGLKNKGAAALRKRLRRPYPLVLGVSVAKTNKRFASEREMIDDWTRGIAAVQGCGDYLTINLSCPNTHDPCTFQDPRLLEKLLAAVAKLHIQEPVFLKVGPDNDEQTIKRIIAVAKRHSYVKGFIISNLAKDRSKLSLKTPKSVFAHRPGGVSGPVMKSRALTTLRLFRKHSHGRFIFIGCGGISSAEDAYEYIEAGASLVQLITGMIFHGPGLIKEIKKGLVRLLERDGLSHISEVVRKEKKSTMP
ncbi:quinone-dependent dihydroorotate dehydrogenase [Candidatus Woesearchaeota archaeon]|nr:MAG: quinone-dependent dihydroorotate dehydrogenase [Candidatus Woesearchaeota archaeon]